MDFVVVGFGLGALTVLVGLLLRDRGAPWRRRPATSAAERDAARRLDGTTRRGGGLLTAAGGLLLLATAAALVLGLDDRAGAILVLAIVALALVLGLAWVARSVPRRVPVRPVRPVAPASARAGASASGAHPAAVPLRLVRTNEANAEPVSTTGDDLATALAEDAPAGASGADAAPGEPPSSTPGLDGVSAGTPSQQAESDVPIQASGQSSTTDGTPGSDAPVGGHLTADDAPAPGDAVPTVATGDGRAVNDAAASAAERAHAETDGGPSEGSAHQRPSGAAPIAGESVFGNPEHEPAGAPVDRTHEEPVDGAEAAPGETGAHLPVVPSAPDRAR